MFSFVAGQIEQKFGTIATCVLSFISKPITCLSRKTPATPSSTELMVSLSRRHTTLIDWEAADKWKVCFTAFILRTITRNVHEQKVDIIINLETFLNIMGINIKIELSYPSELAWETVESIIKIYNKENPTCSPLTLVKTKIGSRDGL